MSSITVTADPAHPAGHALVRVAGAAGSLDTPGFRLQRDAGWGDDKLGPGGWQSSDALLQPAFAERDGTDLLLHVGWDVCHHLEAGVYELSVPAAGVEPTGVFWPDIVTLHAGSILPAVPAPPAPRKPMPKSLDTEATIRVPPAPPSPVQAADVPQTEKPGPAPPIPGARASRTRAVLLGGIGLLLLAAVGAVYALRGTAHFMPPDAAAISPVIVPPEPPVPAPPEAPPAAPTLGSLSVPDVIAKAPDPAAIRVEGEQRLAGDRKDDGLLLLEVASERADAAAAAVLARLYDPVVFQPGGPIPRPDARQAARYYRDAARGGADVAAARDALRLRLQAQAQGGDLGADLMLKDFWP